MSACCHKEHSRQCDLSHPNTRLAIREKYNRFLVAQCQVTFNRRHLIFALKVAFCVDAVIVTLQGRAPEVSGLLYGINSKCWLYVRVSELLYFLKRKQMSQTACAPIPASFLSGHLLRSTCLHLVEFL